MRNYIIQLTKTNLRNNPFKLKDEMKKVDNLF